MHLKSALRKSGFRIRICSYFFEHSSCTLWHHRWPSRQGLLSPSLSQNRTWQSPVIRLFPVSLFCGFVLLKLPVQLTPPDNLNSSSPFALSCFHKMSSPLRTCPPLLPLIGYFRPRNLCHLYLFTRFIFVRFQLLVLRDFTYSCHLATAGSPVPLFSLCKRLAFSIPYIIQPVSVYIRCT